MYISDLTQINSLPKSALRILPTTDPTQQTIGLSLTNWLPLARTPRQLVDALNLLLTSNSLSPAAIDRVSTAISAMPFDTGTNTTNDLERVRSAIYLILTSPQGVIQK